MSNDAVIAYFGRDTVERFVKNYFDTRGKSKETHNELMSYATLDKDTFIDMLCDYMDKEMAQ